MIDWNKSADINGCSVKVLKAWTERYPKSAKKVVAVCDECNIDRELCFYAYRDMCNTCAHRTSEYREMRSKIAIGIFDTQESRDKMSETKKRYYEEHPEAHELHRQLAVKQFSDPVARDAARLKSIEYFFSQESRDAASARSIQYRDDHPEARESARVRGIEQFAAQESRDKMSDIMKNSTVHKDGVEKFVGGNDIVGHHMIYDHSDLTRNIMYMTRSMHTRLHRLFQKHGIDIPHVNTGDAKQL